VLVTLHVVLKQTPCGNPAAAVDGTLQIHRSPARSPQIRRPSPSSDRPIFVRLGGFLQEAPEDFLAQPHQYHVHSHAVTQVEKRRLAAERRNLAEEAAENASASVFRVDGY